MSIGGNVSNLIPTWGHACLRLRRHRLGRCAALLRDHTSKFLLALGEFVGLTWLRFLGWLGGITCRAF